jgi:hypothetical protein
MRILWVLILAPALCGCMGKAQYERYKNSARDLGVAWQDAQDRALCSRGEVVVGSFAYTQCRLDLNRKRIDQANAQAAKEAGQAKAAKTKTGKP